MMSVFSIPGIVILPAIIVQAGTPYETPEGKAKGFRKQFAVQTAEARQREKAAVGEAGGAVTARLCVKRMPEPVQSTKWSVEVYGIQ